MSFEFFCDAFNVAKCCFYRHAIFEPCNAVQKVTTPSVKAAAARVKRSPKLDILDGFDSIEVCTGYMLDGKEIDHLPAGEGAQARVVPVYETIEGWKEPTANARSWADLPAQAIKYVRRVEELVGCPIALLSTSPEREDTILVQNPFEA